MPYLNPLQLFGVLAAVTVLGPLAYVFLASLLSGHTFRDTMNQVLPAVAFLTIFVYLPLGAYILLTGKELGHEEV